MCQHPQIYKETRVWNSELWNYFPWVGRDLKDHLAPTPLPLAGTPLDKKSQGRHHIDGKGANGRERS